MCSLSQVEDYFLTQMSGIPSYYPNFFFNMAFMFGRPVVARSWSQLKFHDDESSSASPSPRLSEIITIACRRFRNASRARRVRLKTLVVNTRNTIFVGVCVCGCVRGDVITALTHTHIHFRLKPPERSTATPMGALNLSGQAKCPWHGIESTTISVA